tara:strand:- start:16947 stop:18182 length:1236 start_codon:yes stop_codon:yes gene_type:complete
MNREEFNDSLSKMTLEVFDSNPEVKENLTNELKNIENASVPTILEVFSKQDGVRPEVLLDKESDLHKMVFKSEKHFENFQKGLERYQDFEQNYLKFELQDVEHERKFQMNEDNSVMQIDPISLSKEKGAKVSYSSDVMLLGKPFGPVPENGYSVDILDVNNKEDYKKKLNPEAPEQELEEDLENKKERTYDDFLTELLSKLEKKYVKKDKNKYFRQYEDKEGNTQLVYAFKITSGENMWNKEATSVRMNQKPSPDDIVLVFSKLDPKNHNISNWNSDEDNVKALQRGLEKAVRVGVLDLDDLTYSKDVPENIKDMIDGLKNNRNTIGHDLKESPVESQPKFDKTDDTTPNSEPTVEDPDNGKNSLTETPAQDQEDALMESLSKEIDNKAEEPTVKEEQKARNTNRNKRSNK